MPLNRLGCRALRGGGGGGGWQGSPIPESFFSSMIGSLANMLSTGETRAISGPGAAQEVASSIRTSRLFLGVVKLKNVCYVIGSRIRVTSSLPAHPASARASGCYTSRQALAVWDCA